MAVITRFEDIEAWQTARELANLIYSLTEDRTFARDYGLKDQIRRAAISVLNNIAEGFESRTQALFLDFLGRAKGSAGEVRSQLYITLDRKYISQVQFDTAYELADKCSRQIYRFMSYLISKPNVVREDQAEYTFNVQRSTLQRSHGFTLWFTGLSGSGKTTLARRVEKELHARGLKVEVLDGDVVRQNLSKGLGFSKEDRDTNIRRIGFVCNLLSRNGVVAIAAAISPYRAVRDEVRASQDTGRFVEVFVDCPIEVLMERDVKGLYQKALNGELQNFTGVSDPYEPPENPEIVVHTDRETEEESGAKILAWLEERGYVPLL